jgi:hypothetical protein
MVSYRNVMVCELLSILHSCRSMDEIAIDHIIDTPTLNNIVRTILYVWPYSLYFIYYSFVAFFQTLNASWPWV